MDAVQVATHNVPGQRVIFFFPLALFFSRQWLFDLLSRLHERGYRSESLASLSLPPTKAARIDAAVALPWIRRGLLDWEIGAWPVQWPVKTERTAPQAAQGPI